MTRIAVVFHSDRGHTRVLAEAVARGAASVGGVEARVMPVEAVVWSELADADAIVFGCPTYMGSASAAFKAFMDASSARAWATQAWRDKIAAGFTSSSARSGDKLNTLVQLAVFAAQHGMVWVGLDLMPGHSTSRGSERDLNRLGSHLGAMAQSDADLGPDQAPPESDRRTAEQLGRRVALAARRWTGAAIATEPGDRHPATAHWSLPADDRAPLPAPLRRVSLRTLAARPGRFEHHLVVVARVGAMQVEMATASEPLYFAHANISDEYAIALPTGDPLLESVSFLTFLSDPESGADVGRLRHGAGDLVLHPHGLLHWPGRLRPPFEPYRFGPGARRCGLSLVMCGAAPVAPVERPAFVSAGRDADAKRYVERGVPFLLADTRKEEPRRLGAVGDAVIDLLVAPGDIAPARGGYIAVLSAAAGGPLHDGDLVHVPEGAALDGRAIGRALLFSSAVSAATAPPRSWDELPAPPFAPYEEAAPGALPLDLHGLHIEEASPASVRVEIDGRGGEVPRYWMARGLFRLALHGYRLGYVETYGGFFYDDRDGTARLGVRGAGSVALAERELPAAIEALYRAVAPAGYVERLM